MKDSGPDRIPDEIRDTFTMLLCIGDVYSLPPGSWLFILDPNLKNFWIFSHSVDLLFVEATITDNASLARLEAPPRILLILDLLNSNQPQHQ
jgi:hypothetical protein